MTKHTYRVVTRASDGTLRIRDFDTEEPLLKMHTQIGIDDCSTDLSLRGKPVFRGLIGPMPDGKGVARYESPEVFETLTKEWINAQPKRRRRRASLQIDPAHAELPSPQGSRRTLRRRRRNARRLAHASASEAGSPSLPAAQESPALRVPRLGGRRLRHAARTSRVCTDFCPVQYFVV